tara:strand:+ start:1459 stop:2430 length:972 start_codon:yes stop_codon:yes gene_type:complete
MDSQSHSQLHSAWAVLAHRPPSPFEAAFVRNLSRALRPINVPLTVMLDATTRRSNASDCGTLRRCTHDPLLAAKTEAAWLSRTADANVAVVTATQADVASIFPSFVDRQRRLNTADVGWRAHEYVLLTLRQQRRLPAASFYWVSEADVFFKGDAAAWVRRTQAAHAIDDLLPPSPRAPRGWVQFTQERDNQPGYLRGHDRRGAWHASQEHVRRFSGRLLDALHTSLALDVYVWGEALAPTLCHTVALFHCAGGGDGLEVRSGSSSADEHDGARGWPRDTWSIVQTQRGRFQSLAPTPPWSELPSERWWHREPRRGDGAIFDGT